LLSAGPLEDKHLWKSKGVPNWKLLREHLRREGPLTKAQVTEVLHTVLGIFTKEPNMLQI
jgi:hypothetical protein